jgi:hypothetical protein
MRRALSRLWKNRSAAVGAEFALVVPLLVLFLLGIIDVGRLMYTWNRAEKATQMGVRYAAATDMVSDGLATYDFYSSSGIPRGNTIPQSQFGGATCTSSGCSCNAGATCPPMGTFSTAAFDNLVARMHAMMPEIQAANVQVEYGYSGLGYAGDPFGPDMDPLITVRLVNMSFQPTLGYLFGGTITLPAFASTLSTEDGEGTHSY